MQVHSAKEADYLIIRFHILNLVYTGKRALSLQEVSPKLIICSTQAWFLEKDRVETTYQIWSSPANNS